MAGWFVEWFGYKQGRKEHGSKFCLDEEEVWKTFKEVQSNYQVFYFKRTEALELVN